MFQLASPVVITSFALGALVYKFCWSITGSPSDSALTVAVVPASAPTRPALPVDRGNGRPDALGVSAPSDPGVRDGLVSSHATAAAPAEPS